MCPKLLLHPPSFFSLNPLPPSCRGYLLETREREGGKRDGAAGPLLRRSAPDIVKRWRWSTFLSDGPRRRRRGKRGDFDGFNRRFSGRAEGAKIFGMPSSRGKVAGGGEEGGGKG